MIQPGTKVLLIADDQAVRAEIVVALSQSGAVVKATGDGADAVLLSSTGWRPDFVVVDLLLSTRDAYVTYRALRSAFGVPVIVSAPSSSRFGGHVEDVIARPIEVGELVERIAARTRIEVPSPDVVRAGELLLMPRAGKAFLDGEEIHVNADEIALLICLATNAGQEVRRDQLRLVLRGATADIDPRMVDVHLIRLMVKLGSARTLRLWRTPGNDAYVLQVEQPAGMAARA